MVNLSKKTYSFKQIFKRKEKAIPNLHHEHFNFSLKYSSGRSCLLVVLMMILFSLGSHAQEKDGGVLKFSMKTRWAGRVNENKPWDKYPRPQLKRDNWTNLNGLWDYAILPKNVLKPTDFDGKILVPFPVESSLSKVKKLVGEDNYLWYHTNFDAGELEKGEELHLNFGAVDWETTVYVNGKVAGGHKGGFTPFSVDVTPYLTTGKQELLIRVWDPTDSGTQPRGKQLQNPQGIWYTPVTGIWQTVWLEKTSQDYIDLIKTTPDLDNSKVNLEIRTSLLSRDLRLKVVALKNNEEEVTSNTKILSAATTKTGISLDVPDPELWSPDHPFLYDLKISLETPEGETVDEISSYFGMRKISLGKGPNGYTRILLNDKPLFQLGLLDQGWWPDGLYTAPTEEAMMYDVEMTRKMGFNMLRKHVKVEPARFYYNCDKMGMLVWQDMPNGNHFKKLRIEAWDEKDVNRSFDSAMEFETELKEMMDHLHSFPSIVVWVPFNEGWGQYDTERIAKWVSAYDPSRLNDAPSGWADRGVGDFVDTHIYPGPGMEFPEKSRASVIGEFGGLGLTIKDHMWWDKKNWGYLTYSNKEDYQKRFHSLIKDLVGLKSLGLSAAIYTQTTDVEGEVNGLMTYDREAVKVDPSETKQLFEPLYEKPKHLLTIVPDSEHASHDWLVKTEVNKKWYKFPGEESSWNNKPAPFSSYDNFFLPAGSAWKENTMYLVKKFEVSEIPEQINLRYYLQKANMEIYLNGKLLTREKDEGGRKRHYRNKLIEDANKYLKKGENLIAIKLEGQQQEKDRSFDIGIYTTEEPLKTSNRETN